MQTVFVRVTAQRPAAASPHRKMRKAYSSFLVIFLPLARIQPYGDGRRRSSHVSHSSFLYRPHHGSRSIYQTKAA